MRMRCKQLFCLLILWASAGSYLYAATPKLPGGDVNGDGGLDIGDVVYLLGYLFGGGPEPAPCGPCEGGEDLPPPWTALRKASAGTADINGDWRINVSDPIALLGYLFADGPPPVPCGVCWPGGAHLLPATGLRGCCRGYPEEEGGWGALQVPCNDPAWPGQDAQTQLGCPPEERFVDNGDGTITDLCTGLMWQKSCAVPPGTEEPYKGAITWDEALLYADQLEFAGYDDWRMPNIFELWSVTLLPCNGFPDRPDGVTPVDEFPEPFERTPTFSWSEKPPEVSGGYWSSTSPEVFWGRVLLFGRYGIEPYERRFLRCVRGGTDPSTTRLPATGCNQCYVFDPVSKIKRIPCDDPRAVGQDSRLQIGCPMEGRFVDNGDGTITDLCTGLMWQKKPPTVPPEYEGDEYGMTTWQGALRYANDLEFAGYDDWRLPNLHELVFISDWYNEGWPPTGLRKNVYPFEWPEKRRPGYPVYWTSSATEYYWHRLVYLAFGGVAVNEPPNRGSQCGLLCRAYVRCVRGPIWIQGK